MAETVKGEIIVTRYVPITGITSKDVESYDDAMFSAMSDLMGRLGYELMMRTESDMKTHEAWLQLTAKKKDDPR